MDIIHLAKRCVLAAPLALSLLAAPPAYAQGDGPIEVCAEQAAGSVEAFEACLVEHEAEIESAYGLPTDWRPRLEDYLAAHPDGWDRIEDLADALENRRDRAENARDRHENWFDAWEDQHDDEVDLEDVFDRLENVRDRAENRWDRRENARDHVENRWDRRH